MRPNTEAILIFVLALVGLGGIPAEAEQGTHCSFEFVITLSPGLSMGPSSGTHDGDGLVTCEGLVNGKQPTGSGTLGDTGPYGTKDPDSCSGGEGTGVDTLKIPTAGGLETVISEFTFTFGDRLPTHGGLGAGEFKGSRFSGWFEFTPTKGDCVTAPVTEAKVVGEGIIHA